MALSFFNKKKDDKSINQVIKVPVSAIVPNRFQPRKVFNADNIAELASTIEQHGLLQPIILREYEDQKYEIIAGERRFRAIQTLKWAELPAIVQTMDDHETASMALIENLQREELTAVEEAQAYKDLMKLNDFTQASLAEKMGKSQSFVANKLRLLKLSQPVQEAIMNHEISERHGRSLLRLDEFKQQMILHQILAEQLTVKDTEALVNKTLNPEPESTEETVDATDGSLKEATTKAKKANDKAKKAIAHDTRIAVNTIKKSVQMVEQSGIAVKATEEEQDDVYRITIEIPKQ
ncbi:nucleoid occlusion protein [Latilactobacillus curvatus]|uniref:Nucleoid occlusion protein n=1 Tax=Latilactobacillus curvatus JCM 1096 = DSM 20019 TaxID=1293592 RepID=A0AAJ0LFJ6_LATCU|nr:nucleoid occlusion protein [Latilactobacillus curvatus]KRK93052.1 nucleoid occlusion protein [Latilactobacillus curvatus JCM 1096 = DSM 20019]MCT3529986.1 nucleoid occlusion protein [Latilactobacillus curvatus]MDG2988465.1 nucleoid occlusion protein [Latilactobacillus curvatus]QAS50296.1 nucleoid occlusion protein [Latilactobacillus curvatus JCM 1096 = DSM 20019]GED81858.1 nucleoid occlusion protein [Latilactobacillus curvatus]